MTASVGPSPKVRKFANARLIPFRFSAIAASVRSWRDVSLPEGSPTLVVPPPISTIGR